MPPLPPISSITTMEVINDPYGAQPFRVVSTVTTVLTKAGDDFSCDASECGASEDEVASNCCATEVPKAVLQHHRYGCADPDVLRYHRYGLPKLRKLFIGQVRRQLRAEHVAHMLGVSLGRFDVVLRVEKIVPRGGAELGCYHVYIRDCHVAALRRQLMVYSDVSGFWVARDRQGFTLLQQSVAEIRATSGRHWSQSKDLVTLSEASSPAPHYFW